MSKRLKAWPLLRIRCRTPIELRDAWEGSGEWSPPGGGRNRWENRQVEWAGAHESKREPSEFQSPKAVRVNGASREGAT